MHARPARLSRREVLIAGASSAAAVHAPAATASPPAATSSPQAATSSAVSLVVNGQPHTLEVDHRTTLLDLLRDRLRLTGTKKGCDQGQCGACTVLLDGRRVNACLTLAVMLPGAQVTTIEGLGSPGNLHPLQAAFVEKDGYQCGYCTPGQICSAVGMLDEIQRGMPSHATEDLVARPLLSPAELRERMSGNLCRCGAYANIAEAISQVAA